MFAALSVPPAGTDFPDHVPAVPAILEPEAGMDYTPQFPAGPVVPDVRMFRPRPLAPLTSS